MTSHASAWLALALSLGACGQVDRGGGVSGTGGSRTEDDGLVTDGGDLPWSDDSGGQGGGNGGPRSFPLYLDRPGAGGKAAGKVHGHFLAGHCPKRTSDPATAHVRFEFASPGEADRLGARGVLYTSTNKPSEPLGFVDLAIERPSGAVRCHLPYVGDMAFPFDGEDPACRLEEGTELSEPVTGLSFSVDPEAYYSSPCIVNLRFADDSYMESSQE